MFEQELNAYWKTVVDTIKDGIMIVDIDFQIINVTRIEGGDNTRSISPTDNAVTLII